MTIPPANVHTTLSKYMLVDGFDLVLDLEKSKGSRIYNARTANYMLDMFSFFATAPLGCNHPKLTTPDVIKKLGKIAVNNPSNSDVYTTEMAEFVETFGKYAVPPYFKHLFFIAGGALAVENGLKAAFDWKIRKNKAQGKQGEIGTQVIHFKEAFHGRTGYTLSMTNTFNQDKIKYFPKFNWPRITNPKCRFPLTKENLALVQKSEQQAIAEIEKAVAQNPDDIAALIIEPIQGEGGDNHFRKEFFQELRRLCTKHDIMFMVDEVQTGVGLTGKMWAHEHYGVKPDILAFGKKTQVCGIMVGNKIDEVKENVFTVPSRINSTWGGNLIDMVRCQMYLEIIHEEKLIKNAEIQGKRLLAGLEDLSEKYENLILNPRGRGLMCAFDLPTPELRDELKRKAYAQNMIILGCGASTIRFRPPLIVTAEEIDQALDIINHIAQTM
ncbi:MAG: L-lysine 6-transaminase [Candidatus Thermoplasmatota archaeon]